MAGSEVGSGAVVTVGTGAAELAVALSWRLASLIRLAMVGFFTLQSFGGIKVSREDSMTEFGGESMQSTMERGCIDVGNFLGRLTLRGPLHSVCCENCRQTKQCHKEQLKKADT